MVRISEVPVLLSQGLSAKVGVGGDERLSPSLLYWGREGGRVAKGIGWGQPREEHVEAVGWSGMPSLL